MSNLTKEWSAYVFDIGVAYKENTDNVLEIMKAVGKEMFADPRFAFLMLEPPEIFGVDKFDDSAVIIKGRIKTKPIRQWEVGREFLRRVKLAFDENGIEIPFPTDQSILVKKADHLPYRKVFVSSKQMQAKGPADPFEQKGTVSKKMTDS